VFGNNTDISKQLAASIFREVQRVVYLEVRGTKFFFLNVCAYTPAIAVSYTQRLETSSALPTLANCMFLLLLSSSLSSPPSPS
jgi:hypothetical protein